MNRLIRIGFLTVVLLIALTAVVYAQGSDPQDPDADTAGATAGTVALLLAPLVAAAAAIERMIEMGFDFVEGVWLSVTKIPEHASSYLAWARQQVNDAREKLTSNRVAADQGKLETALQDAQMRLEGILKRDPYKSIKRVITVVAGIVLGLIVSFLTNLQMFKLLGADLVRLSAATPGSSLARFLTTMDIIVTGLVIGTGSAPVHSLIGILQKSKDAIEEARALAAGKANATQVELFKLLQEQVPTPPAEPAAAALGGEEVAMGEGALPSLVPQAIEREAPSPVEVERTINRLLGR